MGGCASAGPPPRGRHERLGRRFLGDVEVAETAREAGDHPRPLLGGGTGDRLLDGGTGHGFSNGWTDSSVRDLGSALTSPWSRYAGPARGPGTGAPPAGSRGRARAGRP